MITIQSKPWPGLMLLGLLATTPAGAETLQQAWDIALEVDHSLKVVRENSAAAAQQLEAAKAARLPEMSLEAGYTVLDNTPASKTNFGSAPSAFPVGEKNSLSYKAIASLPLYTSGRISSGIDAADAVFQASRTQVSGKALDLKLTVAEVFVSVLRAAQGLM
jgi:outer membrane protein TolC